MGSRRSTVISWSDVAGDLNWLTIAVADRYHAGLSVVASLSVNIPTADSTGAIKTTVFREAAESCGSSAQAFSNATKRTLHSTRLDSGNAPSGCVAQSPIATNESTTNQ